MTIHIADADAKTLAVEDVVTQAGIPYRIVGFDQWHNGNGRQVERVYAIPTHNGDGIPMGPDASLYSSAVNRRGYMSPFRWFCPRDRAHSILANRDNFEGTL